MKNRTQKPLNVESLLHELEAHRVELEMQNEHLRSSQDDLASNLERYTLLFDFAPIGYALLSDDETVVAVNHAGASLLDEMPLGIVGKRFQLFVARDQRGALDTFFSEVRKTCVKKSIEVLFVRAFGPRPTVRLTANSQPGKSPTILLAFEDISAQVLAEQRMREAEERRRIADRRKDEFLAVLSHELRTPLSSSLIHSQLLQRGGLSEATVIASGKTLERATRAQLALIDDLLDVSRIVSGTMKLAQAEVDIKTVVDAALDTVDGPSQVKDIAVQATFGRQLFKVLGDPGRLLQAVQNLLANAIKFTPKHGQVCVTVDAVGTEVRIEVRDTGIGIDPEFLPQLFQMFVQADRTPTRATGGLGLGLSIVRSIVEAHGGTVRAESAGPGAGSLFAIQLPGVGPSAAESEKLPASSIGPTAHLKGARLLVVEDDDLTREALIDVLASAGATVRSASSGNDAMRVLGRFKPDLVLCDIAMPGEDGYSLLRRMRSRKKYRGSHVPMVALTAFADEKTRSHTKAAGFEEHLAKPVDIGQLLSTLSGLMAKEESRPPKSPSV